MKRMPYGVTDYKELIEKNCYYVDKTKYLEQLENMSEKITYFRPRRFGKTLLTSMMYYYYDINSRDLFETLFKDTYIYDNPTVNKNNYYVLRFDFSSMNYNPNNIEDIESEFAIRVLDGIKDFNTYYDMNMIIDKTKKKPNLILLDLIDYIREAKLEHKLYIIIDEYDNFTNSILGSNTEMFKMILGDTGFVKSFYSLIKAKSGTIIDRVFITGVCSISIDAMTSGFNIATDITNEKEFNAMTALTHDEVKTLIKEVDIENREEIFKTMLINYDGYKFNKNADELVFNPTLVMYYLSNYYTKGEEPEELFDKNIISSFEQIRNVITLKDNKYYMEILESIFNTKSVKGILISNFDINMDITKDIITSLLYYFGYITISKEELGNLVYVIPNKVIEKIFYDYFIFILKQNNIEFNSNVVEEAIYEIAKEGKINKITKMVETVISKSSNRVLERFSEKNIQLIYSALLSIRNVFDIYNEYEVANGYIDLMIFKKDKDTNYDIMIELKYIKKKEYSSKVLEGVRQKAIEQINNYVLDDRVDKTNLKKYVVIFVGKKLEVLEEV